jgi:hypothetical protein
VRILQNTWFGRFAKNQQITDKHLCDAIKDAQEGNIDADLGGGVIKQRVAKPQKGKSKGWRVIVAFRKTSKAAFFLFGFPKSSQENISRDELKGFKLLAKDLLKLNDKQLDTLVEQGKFSEVSHGKEV